MERITTNGAHQSLTANGYRFTAPPIEPEVGWFCNECWWYSRDSLWRIQHQEQRQSELMEQVRLYQQQMIQGAARERNLRQQLTTTQARLQQVERRARRHTRTRNFMETLSLRLERIENHLGVLDTPIRRLPPLVIDVDLDSPLSVADQGN